MSDEPSSVLDVPGAIQAHDVEHVVDASALPDAPTTPRFPFVPAWYGLYFVAMSKTARSLGYALALHGSMQRDVDVIAAPWTDEAASAEELIAAFVECHGLMRGTHDGTAKPHGRVAYDLHLGGHFYFDVSVLPRKPS